MDALAVAELLNEGSGALWANLGLWQPGDRYGDAARRLALELGRRAVLGPGHRVVDVGCGGGDQLLLWVEEFGVDEVYAIEPEPALVAVARRRIAEHGLDARIRVIEADVRELAALPRESFDRVLALDCAYHFPDRPRAAADAHRVLRDDGAFVLTDLMLEGAAPPMRLDRLAPVFGIQRGHLIPADGYRRALVDAGFASAEIESVTDAVAGGFARHVRQAWSRLLAGGSAAVPTLLTAAACGAAARGGRIVYAFVRADRASPSSKESVPHPP